jgi:hypothetical protein
LEREAPNGIIGLTRTRNVLAVLLFAKRLMQFGFTFKQVAFVLLTQKECHPVRFVEAKPTVIGIGTVNTQRNWATVEISEA